MNIFDKLKLPFAKKVKQVPVSWVEEGPEHYYVIHHLLFGYSDSTSVPNGYADMVIFYEIWQCSFNFVRRSSSICSDALKSARGPTISSARQFSPCRKFSCRRYSTG